MYKVNGVEVSAEEYQNWLNLITDVTDKFVGDIKEKQKKEIKVGDFVRVVNKGEGYTTYSEWVFQNVKGARKCRYAYTESCYNGMIGRVIAMSAHLKDPDRMLCYVETSKSGKCYLINTCGLEKVKED